ncbi:MAG: hypothetical protein E7601_00285 [Ruminococcaceae bacterium]|nr:hypothetical protein [Oscillospiraceae bacterium]
MKKFIRILAVLFAVIMLASVPVGATAAYQTYIYSSSGFPLYSPDAYSPQQTVDSNYMGLTEVPIEDPRDIVVDKDDNVYIVDMKTNRIIVLDKYYKLKFTIEKFINQNGIEDEFTAPQGVFVSERMVSQKDEDGNVVYDDEGKPVRVEEKLIYVCDTNANRIVVFDENGEFVKVIPQPEDQLFEEDAVYKPVAMAVDDYGRLYVVSSTTYQGIIMMTSDGVFTGFIGAQKVSLSAWEIIVRMFRTEAQKAVSETTTSTEFNNIDIDTEGFIYATISSIDEKDVANAIRKKSKAGTYAPVKMLNGAGEEIMRRNGFYPPSGEVQFMGTASTATNTMAGPSKVTDVAVGPERTWSIIDEKRSKIFTYDFDGNLLFAFGDVGQQLGNISMIKAICYQGSNLLVLDNANKSFTVFTRTEYGDILITALQHENERLYNLSKTDWENVLMRNSNFDEAYIGIGQALYKEGRYEESLVYYKAAYDVDNYSKSYQEIRKAWIQDWIILIPVVVIAVCLAYSFLFKWANKINRAAAISGKKKTFKEELLYGFHVIFHPFDGFWDLKHEKRGSVRASLVFIALTVISFFYQAIGESYLANPQGSYTTIFIQLLGVVVPLGLWVVANWCLTTLFDGEGSMKDIFIATSYSLVPLILILAPATLVTNVLTKSELNIVDLVVNFGFIWMGLLLFCGMMVTHDYTVPKNIATCAFTIVAMVFIMFVGILFSTLLSEIVSFVSNIILEINYRI